MDYNLLSQHEPEIAALVAAGASNKEIARQLALSIKTVKNVLTKVFENADPFAQGTRYPLSARRIRYRCACA